MCIGYQCIFSPALAAADPARWSAGSMVGEAPPPWISHTVWPSLGAVGQGSA